MLRNLERIQQAADILIDGFFLRHANIRMLRKRTFIGGFCSTETGNVGRGIAPCNSAVLTDSGDASVGQLQQHGGIAEGIVPIVLSSTKNIGVDRIPEAESRNLCR